jgi:glycolate oxidase
MPGKLAEIRLAAVRHAVPAGVEAGQWVSDMMKRANSQGVRVSTVGPVEGRVHLDLNDYHGVEIDPVGQTFTVKAGTTVREIEEFFTGQGATLGHPFQGLSPKLTITDVLARNLAGERGAIGSYLLGVEAVLPGGELYRAGAKVIKNNTGYRDVALFAGLEESMGVVLSATFSYVERFPGARVTPQRDVSPFEFAMLKTIKRRLDPGNVLNPDWEKGFVIKSPEETIAAEEIKGNWEANLVSLEKRGLVEVPKGEWVKVIAPLESSGLASEEGPILVRPKSWDAIPRLIQLAKQFKFTLQPKGAGTNLVGELIAPEGKPSVVIDFCHLRGEVGEELDLKDKSVWVGPNITTDQLNGFLAKHGIQHGAFPASNALSHILANYVMNASGLGANRYGSTGVVAEEVEWFNQEGRLIHSRVDDQAGYTMIQLLAGSEGTLGIVKRVKIRLVPTTPFRITYLLAFNSIEELGKAVSAVKSAPIVPLNIECLEPTIIRAINQAKGRELYPADAAAVLLIEVAGETKAEALAQEGVLDDVVGGLQYKSFKKAGIPDNDERNRLWEGRRAALPAIAVVVPNNYKEGDGKAFLQLDPTVPIKHLAEFMARCWEIAKKLGLAYVNYGHVSDGNCHPTAVYAIKADPEANRETLRKLLIFAHEISQLTVEMGGAVSGEHGIGIEKSPFVLLQLGEAGIKTIRIIKDTFDPEGIFNAGKLIPEGSLEELRVVTSGTPAERLAALEAAPLGRALWAKLSNTAATLNPKIEALPRDAAEFMRALLAAFRRYKLDSCIRCTACLATCPTVNEDGTSPLPVQPRSKVELFAAVLRGDVDIKEVRDYLAECLKCGRCVTACPAGVEVTAAVREVLALTGGDVPWAVRLLSGVWSLQGPRGRRMVQAVRNFSVDPFGSQLIESKGEVALFTGCMGALVMTRGTHATIELLQAAGLSVKQATEVCCGLPFHLAGLDKQFRRLARKNTRNLKGSAQIVTACSGCAHTLGKIYGLGDQVKPLFALAGIQGLSFGQLEGVAAVYQHSCHEQKNKIPTPVDLLRAILGDRLLVATLCCGSGGLSGLRKSHKNLTGSTREAKARELVALFDKEPMRKADRRVVVTQCPACADALKESAPPGIEIIHPTVLLAEALGKN